jgi:hypothetical protein
MPTHILLPRENDTVYLVKLSTWPDASIRRSGVRRARPGREMDLDEQAIHALFVTCKTLNC